MAPTNYIWVHLFVSRGNVRESHVVTQEVVEAVEEGEEGMHGYETIERRWRRTTRTCGNMVAATSWFLGKEKSNSVHREGFGLSKEVLSFCFHIYFMLLWLLWPSIGWIWMIELAEMLRFLFKTRPLRSLLLPSCHRSGRSSGVPSMQVNTLSVKWQLSAKLGQSHHEDFVKKTGCVGCIELHWAYRRRCVIKMLKKFHHSPPWVRLLRTLSPSFGFAAHSSSVIQTLTCFFFLLPTSFAGLLGYGYGEGSCAAYPFR